MSPSQTDKRISGDLLRLATTATTIGLMDSSFESTTNPIDGEPATSPTILNAEDFENVNIPDWDTLDVFAIYDALNPPTKVEKRRQQEWKKKAVDSEGKPIKGVGYVANRLLRELVKMKVIQDNETNKKLAETKANIEAQRLEFLCIEDETSIAFIRTFMKENIKLSVDTNGDYISLEDLSINHGCRVIMMAVESEPSFQYLQEIFGSVAKEDRRRHIDDPRLSWDQNWTNLANSFMNSDDYTPENERGELDRRLASIKPQFAPQVPWSGEQRRKTFKTLNTKVDDKFHRSGHNEGGTDLEVADQFLDYVKQLVPGKTENSSPPEHMILLFAFWAFDRALPQFITRSKPAAQQFDCSDAKTNVIDSHPSKKRMTYIEGVETLANAIQGLVPNSVVEEKKISMLCATEKREHDQNKREENEEKRSKLTWNQHMCERFLSSDH